MHAINIFAAVFIATFSMSLGNPVGNQSQIAGDATIQLAFLGNVDGKSYFTEEIKMDWFSARTHCTLTGMHLATITSELQWDFLKSAYDTTLFTEIYWIGLRDAQEPRQFIWDGSDSEPSLTIGLQWDAYFPASYSTCASFNANVNPLLTGLNIDNCLTPRKVLCET